MSNKTEDRKSKITSPPHAIILAAGKGTRMGGDLPKVVYEVGGKPMVWWVVKACLDAGVQRCIIVIGYKGELVKDVFKDVKQCVFVEQPQQLGTGHAAKMAEPAFEGLPPTDVFALVGDGPLVRPRTLTRVLEQHRTTGAAATVATSVLDDPFGYGRIIREADGSFQSIVEEKDCTPEQKKIREVNPTQYCFRSDKLFKALAQVRNNNSQGEYYLTDVPGLLAQQGEVVTIVKEVPQEDVLGINTPEQLKYVDGLLRARMAQESKAVAGGRA